MQKWSQSSFERIYTGFMPNMFRNSCLTLMSLGRLTNKTFYEGSYRVMDPFSRLMVTGKLTGLKRWLFHLITSWNLIALHMVARKNVIRLSSISEVLASTLCLKYSCTKILILHVFLESHQLHVRNVVHVPGRTVRTFGATLPSTRCQSPMQQMGPK